MTRTNTQERIHENERGLKHDAETLERLETMLSRLESWSGAVINMPFFEEHYTVKNQDSVYDGNRKWVSSQIITRKNWQGISETRLYVAVDTQLIIADRKKETVMSAIREEIGQVNARMERMNERLKRLLEVDEEAVIADLQAVFKKHGEPDTWRDILEANAVRYPSEY